MLFYLLLLSSSASAAILTCDGPDTRCPESRISCVCSDAVAHLQWTVRPPASGCTITYRRGNNPGVVTTLCEGYEHTVVLDAVNEVGDITFSSSLDVAFKRENVTVTCDDTFHPVSTTFGVASM